MEKVLLRKLSLKSIINGLKGGFMENQKVSVALDIMPNKLAYIYFNYEKISFTDDILEILGIKDKYEISKPGINVKMAADYFMDKKRAMTDNQRMGAYMRNKKVNRINHNHNEESRAFYSSKKRLQAKNHGHIK